MDDERQAGDQPETTNHERRATVVRAYIAGMCGFACLAAIIAGLGMLIHADELAPGATAFGAALMVTATGIGMTSVGQLRRLMGR